MNDDTGFWAALVIANVWAAGGSWEGFVVWMLIALVQLLRR